MEDNQLKIIADYLEKMQMYEEASQIDGIIKEAGIGKSIMNTFGPPLTGPRGERGGFMTPDDARAWKQRLNSWTTFFNANLKIATEMANNDKKSPVPKQLVNLFSQMKKFKEGFAFKKV